MKQITIYLIVLVATHWTYGQVPISVDNLMKQKGVKVRTHSECESHGNNCKILYKHFYDTQGRMIKFINYVDNKPFLTAFYSYNNFNKADTVYNQFTGHDKYLSQVYRYDKLGNVIEYLNCLEKSGCNLTEKYEYNSEGKIVKKIEIKNGVEEIECNYIYDKLGDNVEIIEKFKNSDYGRRDVQVFDSNHKLIRSITIGLNNERLDSTEYDYDSKGNLIHLNWMGGLNTKSTYKYDSEGSEVEYKSSAFGNQINDHRIMTYKDKLVQTRIHYDGNKVKNYFKFEYEFY